MGILFRGNTTSIGVEELDLPVLEGYGCSDGYLLSMGECLYNEGVDFNDSMSKEFREVALEMKKADLENKGLFTEASNIEVITEGFTDIIEKLKEFLRKLAAKINSIYESVKTRITSFLTRDYNKFYTSNKDKFNKKYSKFKGNIKWMQPKADFTGGLKLTNMINRISKEFNGVLFTKKESLDNEIENVKDGSYLNTLLCSVISDTDRKSFKKDFKEALFDDKDKVEGVSSDIATEVNKILGTKDIIKNLNDAQKKNKDLFKKILSDLDNIRKKMDKGGSATTNIDGIKKVGFSADYENDSKRLSLLRSRVLALQTVCNMVNGSYISLTKSHIAQCKSVFTKVCAGISEQTLLDTLEECAYDEVLEELEAI